MISHLKRIHPIDTEWFARRMDKTGLSLRDIVARNDGAFSASGLSRVVRGKIPLSLVCTIALAEAFDVSMEEIVRRAGYRPPRR